MKLNFGQFKSDFADKISYLNFDKAKDTIKNNVRKYYKVAGTVAVATALCATCAVSVAGSLTVDDGKTGVILTLSDVKAEQKAFSGNTFTASAITYSDMQNLLYETEQLAELETSEKQIEEVLTAKSPDKKDQAALEALTAQVIVEEPEKKVVVASTTASAQTSTAPAVQAAPTVVTIADENGTYEYLGDYVLTAYCPCSICCGVYSNPANPTTASGSRATAGRTIAADTSKLPFGTQVMINGQIYTVEDRGGAIRGNRIDVYFNTHSEAIAFGRRTAAVYRVVQ